MKLTENIMFVRLSFSLPRQTRKVTAQADVDPDRLRASARLYSGKSFAAIKSHDAETRLGLTRLAIQIPSCFRGAYVLPAGMTERVSEYLPKRQAERAELVSTFLREDYERERESARAALNGSFRESDFPPAAIAQRAFVSDWSVFSMEVPEGLPDSVREAEIAKLGDRMNSVFEECRAALRETMAELVGHLADRLAPDSDGTRKRLCASTVESLREFLDTVGARDITSDDAIRQLSDKARAIIGTVSADTLRESKGTAERVRSGLQAVKSELNGLIHRDGRKIDLDMD